MKKWWRVYYLGGGKYEAKEYEGVTGHVRDHPHWSFFTWSDGSVSNEITLRATSATVAIQKAIAISNPSSVTVDAERNI